ncbi:hypothetical protein ABT160_40190 [Streptomyces sp. NPDC001941]|uniref:hypothetical protein n=1 Tax=Streptomyces sp. NPDC001941 TaxID=3154659 RepID=UPI00331B7446
MRLGKALSTGTAEERPLEAATTGELPKTDALPAAGPVAAERDGAPEPAAAGR